MKCSKEWCKKKKTKWLVIDMVGKDVCGWIGYHKKKKALVKLYSHIRKVYTMIGKKGVGEERGG